MDVEPIEDELELAGDLTHLEALARPLGRAWHELRPYRQIGVVLAVLRLAARAGISPDQAEARLVDPGSRSVSQTLRRWLGDCIAATRPRPVRTPIVEAHTRTPPSSESSQDKLAARAPRPDPIPLDGGDSWMA